MDRRDFVRRAGALGGLGLVPGAGALGKPGAGALGKPGAGAPGEPGAGALGKAGVASGAASRSAMLDLLATLETLQAEYLTPAYGITRAADVAEGERLLAHLLHTGLAFFLEADPERPRFTPYVTPARKLLGDNPDALYYFAPIRGDRRYRIRGRLGAATFTSFTVEAGSGQGGAASASVAELDDSRMAVAADGSFEILLGGERPAAGNWLPLVPEAGQVTTRHYYETPGCVAADPQARQTLVIEALDPPPLAPWGGDRGIARRLGQVANFVRAHLPLAIPDPEGRPDIPWVSTTPNHFTAPARWRSESGYGNLSAWYAMAPYGLRPGEALELSGRFPSCRFANVVLWNRFMQSYDYTQRQVSFNRNQLEYEADGSFRIYVAHEDPGHANWLATEGRPSGLLYWRYLLPTQAPQTVAARVVSL